MLQVYKKVEKSLDNPYGAISIQNLEELNKPFLLCLSAQDSNPKSIFGIIKESARAARVNTTDEMAARFKIDEFPIAFLGLKFEKDDSYKKNYEEIVDLLIYPFLVGNGTKKVEEIKKMARKINFMTYCDGTLTYSNIEKRLEAKLQNDGYSESDIKDILSQISLVAIGTMVDTSDLKATTASFVDVNDSEIYTGRSNGYKKLLHEKQLKSIYGHLGNSNNVLYIFEGSGNHSLKEYFLDNNIVKPAISSVLSKFLQNSIDNEYNNGLVSISSGETLEQLSIYGDETKSPMSLLRDLDDAISYGGAIKYTPEEAIIRHELDISYAEIQKTRLQLERAEHERKKKDAALNLIIEGIKHYSSDTAFYQILVSAKMWQSPAGRDVFQEKSDKLIRQEFNQLFADELQNKQSESGPKL